MNLGARPRSDGTCLFRVWAPRAGRVAIRLGDEGRVADLEPEERGYHAATVASVPADAGYRVVLDGRVERPDPASRWQPEGVHGPSRIVDPRFPWTDAGWAGLPLEEFVTYELHVGTFTEEGTFDAVVPHLDRLRELGITAVELMPVAQFPGARNWGYDGVHPFAVQHSYGGPAGLRRLVDACHARGLAVVLDVVYNHLGPEGNYLADFGPYFTARYRTPWGTALNFDGADSDEVRRYFVTNALHWIEDYHVDALRLDAVHAIVDVSAYTFLEELVDAVRAKAAALGRPAYLIAETDRNDPRTVRPRGAGGLGLDAQWADDFHHGVHARLTGERSGYYADFGPVRRIARSLKRSFALAGDYSRFRRRRHGAPAEGVPPQRFVFCVQNHDQVGNRMRGERLDALVGFEARKLAAAALLLAPQLPLLFMGEEYGETAPFLYFTDHGDPDLVEAVRQGRREEFASFGWGGEPPDPQDPATFRRSRLDHGLRGHGRHRRLHELHGELLRLRRALPCREAETAVVAGDTIVMRRRHAEHDSLALLRFAEADGDVALEVPAGAWERVLDTAAERWGGPGGLAPETPAARLRLRGHAAVLYARRSP